MSARAELEEFLEELGRTSGPLGDTIVRMNEGTLDQPDLDEVTALAARFGALVALDASPASYLVHLTLADKAGMSPTTMKSIFATLAPLVGSARVVSAADKFMQAIQLANRV